MANNINWSAGNPIPTKGGLKVQPYLTTIGPPSSGTNFTQSGYFAFTGNTNFAYTVKDDGTVEYAEFKGGIENGTLGRQFKTLEDAVNNGYITGAALESFRTRLSTELTEKNTNILDGSLQPSPFFLANNPGWKPPTQGTGTAPPPVAPGAPGDGGGSDSENPNANIDPQALTGLGSQLENFDTTNTFGALKESFLKYPTSIDNGQDRIMITQIEYVPSGITAANTNINQISELLGNRDSQLTKSLGMVVLPMPNDISETNQTAWGESSLSTIAAALMNPAARAAQGLATANPGESIDAVRGLGETLFSGQTKNRLNQFLTTNAAASLIKLGGINVDPEAYLNRVTGVAINPNLELLFNGPKLRQFGFSFKMTPRSADEARNIRSIVKFFKKGMAPRRSTVAEKSIYLGTPNVFKLKFVTGADKDIEGIGRIKTCALVSCTVNYTPDGFYAAYDGPNGSQPIATVMQLAFTELTPVYNDEYDAEGDGAENSIGPEGSEYKITGSSESPTPSSGIGLPNDLANGLPGIGLPGINPGGR